MTRKEFEEDVAFEVWRSGGDPDRIDFDNVEDAYYRGLDYDEASLEILKKQRKSHEYY